MVNLKDKMNIKIYADGADLSSFEELNKNPKISGFTTNPSLMKKSGVTDYKKFAKEVLKIVKRNLFHLRYLLMILMKWKRKLEKSVLGEKIFM